jgi:hypothetical protein
MLLEREPEHSFDNWGELQAFINYEASSPHENFGLAFILPADPSNPGKSAPIGGVMISCKFSFP